MIEFRKVLKDDIPKLVLLYTKLILYIKNETEDPYFEVNELSEIELIDKFNTDIKDKTKKIFIALDKKDIVGFVSGEIIDCFLPVSKITKVGYVSSAYVDEKYRNKGLMKKLEKMIMDFFREYELEYVELNVISNNIIGKNAWEKLGYTTFREQMRKKL